MPKRKGASVASNSVTFRSKFKLEFESGAPYAAHGVFISHTPPCFRSGMFNLSSRKCGGCWQGV